MERNPSPRTRRTTLRDVAQAAGVSIWTASNTFSNPDRVPAATRQRVLAAAGALDFVGPNPGARTLALGRTGMVAFVAPGEAELLLGDPAAALVAHGLLTRCDRAGLSLVLTGRPDGELVDGRVFFRTADPSAARGPVVVIDGDAPDGVASVIADVRGGAAALAQHLRDLGHERLAVLSRPGGETRLAGVADGWGGDGPLNVYLAGARNTDPQASSGSGVADRAAWPTRADGEAAARVALSQRPRPTALLALGDTLAMGALEAARWMGLRVPEDVSIAGLDDLPGSDTAGLTTAFVPYRPLGELAGDILLARIAGEPVRDVPPLPAPLTVRRSTGPPPG